MKQAKVNYFKTIEALGKDQSGDDVVAKMKEIETDDTDLLERLRLHIDRGVRQLSVRLKSPADAAELIAGSA